MWKWLNSVNKSSKHGATPAIAIIGGKIKVGLTEDQIELIGKRKRLLKPQAGFILCAKSKLLGATTVTTTMFAVVWRHKIMATGGIGGCTEGR